jgi:hypothetical protein
MWSLRNKLSKWTQMHKIWTQMDANEGFLDANGRKIFSFASNSKGVWEPIWTPKRVFGRKWTQIFPTFSMCVKEEKIEKRDREKSRKKKKRQHIKVPKICVRCVHWQSLLDIKRGILEERQ